MQRTLTFRDRARRRPGTYRPQLEPLEERLPPGDAVLGSLLARSFLEPSPLRGDARPWPAASRRGDGLAAIYQPDPLSILEPAPVPGSARAALPVAGEQTQAPDSPATQIVWPSGPGPAWDALPA